MNRMVGIRNYKERQEAIQGLNLTSDLLSSVTFEDIVAVQEVLQILTGIRDLKVIRVEPQRSYRNLHGHSSVSDLWAEDSRERQYNLDYSDFRFIPINLFKYCFYKISKQVCRNNCFNNLLQVD